MCYNCEGEVDLDVIVCPFCAADLREEKPEQQIPSYNPTATLKNLTTQQSLYPSQKSHHHEETSQEEERVIQAEEEPKNVFAPIILLALGSQLLLLGLFLLFFSSKGSFILKWDARFWYFYILASIPLLIFGAKAIKKL